MNESEIMERKGKCATFSGQRIKVYDMGHTTDYRESFRKVITDNNKAPSETAIGR